MVFSVFIGLMFVIFGLGFLLHETMDFEFMYYLRTYWPSLLVLFGIVKLFDRKSSKTGSLFVILIGGLLQAKYLGYIEVSIWKLFVPLVLILIGISLIFPDKEDRTSKKININIGNEKKDWEEKKFHKAHTNNVDIIRETVIFSGNTIRNESEDFKGGSISTIFASYDLDLRKALIKEEGVYLDISILFGSIDIWVPENWRVEVSASPIFGSWDNNGTNENLDSPVLRIRGPIIFGSLDIR